MKKLLCSLLLFSICWLHFTSKVGAFSQTVFFEDFANDLSQWQDARNSLDNWQLVDGQLEVNIATQFTISELIPRPEFWTLGVEPYQFELDFAPLMGADRNITFAVVNNGQWLGFHFVGNDVHFSKVENGQVVYSQVTNYRLNNGQTYHVTIKHDHDHLQLIIDGAIIFDQTAQELEYTGGTISLMASTGAVAPAKVRFDNVKVTKLTTAETDFHFKQTDPLWSDEEYDAASNWSKSGNGIGRWGCALSSMAMILRSHQINRLPSGAEINPKTLNEWLKSQPDGYIGDGLLNWIAVTRLTWQINELRQTPKLEYQKHLIDPKLVAAQEAMLDQDSILQIAGHFLVAKGVKGDIDSGNFDLMIKDPQYDYTMFSQHNQPLISTRTFHPSFTDLSYMLFVVKPTVELSVYDDNGTELAKDQTSIDYYVDRTSDESSPKEKIVELAKPKNGHYKVELSNSSLVESKITIFAYDSKGNPTDLSQSLIIGPTTSNLDISFQNELGSSIVYQSSWTEVNNLIEQLWADEEINRYSTLIVLKRLINFATHSPQNLSSRYKTLFLQTLAKYKHTISNLGYSQLVQVAEAVQL